MNWLEKFFELFGIKKDFISILSGNAFSMIILGGFWLVLASIMTVEDYGKLNFLISLATIASIISLLGFTTTIKTYLPKGEEDLHKQASLLVLITNVIIIIPVFIFSNNLYVVFLFLATSFF